MYVTAIVFVVVILAASVYLFLIKGRNSNKKTGFLENNYFAHRGLHGEKIPENSLKAFKAAKDNRFGAEFDVHITADGVPVVIHDSSLLRTAGADIIVENTPLNKLREYRLQSTEEKIPLLREVLDIFGGEVPLIIELKSTPGKVGRLCSAVAGELKGYDGNYCIESFDPRCLRWFKRHVPQIPRGQLSENYFKNKNSRIPFFLKFVMTFLLINFLGKPDFIAYSFKDRKNISCRLCTDFWKMKSVLWTIKTEKELQSAAGGGAGVIFEGFIPEK